MHPEIIKKKITISEKIDELVEKYRDNPELAKIELELFTDELIPANKYIEKIRLWLSSKGLQEEEREGVSYILSVRGEIISKLGYNNSTRDNILLTYIKSIDDEYIIPTVKEMVAEGLEELNDLLNDFKPFEYKTTEEKGGRPKGVTKKTIDRYKKVFHQFEILNKKYSSKTKAELYELLATRDYDGKSYKRNTIRNIIEDKKYNLIPSR